MKEIQGKIRFGVIPKDSLVIKGTNPIDGLDIELLDIDEAAIEYAVFNKKCVRLSLITEEQASEFVDSYTVSKARRTGLTQYGSYRMSNKESLISLLKENDVWIKEWCYYKDFDVKSFDDEMDMYDQIQYQDNCPDDLLLIKLT